MKKLSIIQEEETRTRLETIFEQFQLDIISPKNLKRIGFKERFFKNYYYYYLSDYFCIVIVAGEYQALYKVKNKNDCSKEKELDLYFTTIPEILEWIKPFNKPKQ